MHNIFQSRFLISIDQLINKSYFGFWIIFETVKGSWDLKLWKLKAVGLECLGWGHLSVRPDDSGLQLSENKIL